MSLKRSCEQLFKWSGTTTDLCCILLKSGSTYHYHPLAATWRYKRFGTVAVYCIVAVFQCWFLISKKFFFCVKGENKCLTGLWAFSILWTIHPVIRIYMITVNKLSRDMSDWCQYETWHIVSWSGAVWKLALQAFQSWLGIPTLFLYKYYAHIACSAKEVLVIRPHMGLANKSIVLKNNLTRRCLGLDFT